MFVGFSGAIRRWKRRRELRREVEEKRSFMAWLKGQHDSPMAVNVYAGWLRLRAKKRRLERHKYLF